MNCKHDLEHPHGLETKFIQKIRPKCRYSKRLLPSAQGGIRDVQRSANKRRSLFAELWIYSRESRFFRRFQLCLGIIRETTLSEKLRGYKRRPIQNPEGQKENARVR